MKKKDQGKKNTQGSFTGRNYRIHVLCAMGPVESLDSTITGYR